MKPFKMIIRRVSPHALKIDLPPDVEALLFQAIDKDLKYFENHLRRTHRLRRATKPELAVLRALRLLPACPPWHCWFVVVKRHRAGEPKRIFFSQSTNFETNLKRSEIRLVFDELYEAANPPGFPFPARTPSAMPNERDEVLF